ncbi:thiamine phosphate synthase [Halarcobacter anaerophilus]|uniref:thiamine phosphate synthase n=1 Tax=Halarcobacter anaerophilus TaxID=877500 RepID=UPI0005CB3BE0|nr:thiamine phosphate synthase [Halarcobacter anaerophilus]
MNHDFINYLITDPKYYSDNPELFRKNLTKVLKQKQVNIACFRDKESNNYEELAKIFVNVCKENNINKILLNSNYDLSYELKAHGVHLTSSQFDKIKEAKKLDLYTVISCHTFKDLDMAMQFHANAVTYSPIFRTPNKGEPKGISNLKEIVNLYEDLNIIALGGIISKEQIEEIKKSKAYGFASIRYFI